MFITLTVNDDVDDRYPFDTVRVRLTDAVPSGGLSKTSARLLEVWKVTQDGKLVVPVWTPAVTVAPKLLGSVIEGRV